VASDGKGSLGEQGFSGRPTASFQGFISWLRDGPGGEDLPGLGEVDYQSLYLWVEKAPISEEELTERLSEFCGVPYLTRIEEEDVEFKTLSMRFCQAKLVVPVKSIGSRQTVVLSNPFDWELLEDLEHTIPKGRHLAFLLASPGTLKRTLKSHEPEEVDESDDLEALEESLGEELPQSRKERPAYDPEKDPGKGHPVAKLAIALLTKAVTEEASGLFIEPRGSGAVAKANIEGKIHDLQELPLETGKMLVSRIKALSGLDLAKKRTPQTGGLDILLQGKVIKLRLSTSPTTAFENLTVRVLNPSGEASALDELGLSSAQAATLIEMANREQGLVLFVGPSGSGKTTTIYSLLSVVADEERTLVTVEDPIEHKIPFAMQQEVRADASAQALLRHAINEHPDALFLGEIKDLTSARSLVEFTNSGLLTFTSMKSSNAATAVFRLERLGVNRAEIADALIGVVAQRLLRRLCEACKEVRPISKEEAALLEPFTGDIPEAVGHPAGCSSCRGTGYRGQEGVFEVIPVGPRMSQLIRDGRPIAELRDFAQARGDLLVSDHGIRKIRELILPVQDVYREVLLEEGALVFEEADGLSGTDLLSLEAEARGEEIDDSADVPLMTQSSILVVEDEEGTRFLLDQILSKAGYRVVVASDGGEALLKLGSERADLILSDIHMPNLGGLKLLEILNQYGINTPVILLTGEPSPEVEARGREMGVAEYLRKPIQRDVLLERISAVLGEPPG
jgi:type II secretory ATPase GspE/PulE/Tfp pilus assembly ATPase PilB-like protein